MANGASTSLIEPLEGRVLLSTSPAGSGDEPVLVRAGVLAASSNQPFITATRPVKNATNVPRDSRIAVDLDLANAGLNADTVKSSTVKLYRTSDNQPVSFSSVNTSGGGDTIVAQPRSLLAANTQYTFEVTSGVKDLDGVSIVPFTMKFTTGAGPTPPSDGVGFDKVTLSNTAGRTYTAVTIGPDGKLYAATLDGEIIRYNIQADGTLASQQIINSVRTGNGGSKRFLIGLAFDPASTASNLVLWVTHGQYAHTSASDWTGKVSRLTGANLENYEDAVVGLPRSVRDHLTNQLVFGPDGAIYFSQAGNTSMGAPDVAWGNRPERKLSGAILRLDRNAIVDRLDNGQGALNVKTSEGGGSYDPGAPGAALTLYATGIRNAYDLVWHSNGNLYAPTNGSAAGGNTPAKPGVSGTGHTNVSQTQNDYLFRISQGRYYGHPNPARGEYILNGGNPTSSLDPAQVNVYPTGTAPEPNWRQPAYDFGANLSPDGAIEYRGDAFGGALRGSLLVTRYSGGDDIIALKLGDNGITGTILIPGLTGFVDPVDLIEHRATGNIYVAEYGGERITLLRPQQSSGGNTGGGETPSPNTGPVKPSVDRLVLNVPVGHTGGVSRQLTMRNTGTSSVTLTPESFVFTGTDAGMFRLANADGLPRTLNAGETLSVLVNFTPTPGTPVGLKTGNLAVKDGGASGTTLFNVKMRGLATGGLGGAGEPSLARIAQAYEIPIKIGDSNADDSLLGYNLSPGNDLLNIERFYRAGSGDVTIQPLAVFSPDSDPVLRFGWYDIGSGSSSNIFSIPQGESQTVALHPSGSTSFNPGSSQFGIYIEVPSQSNRRVYSEASRNSFESDSALKRKMLVYALRNSDGSIVANAYVVSFEELAGAAADFQDAVFIIRNVSTTPGGSGGGGGGSTPALSGLKLINADTDGEIGAFTNGANLDAAANAYSIAAEVLGSLGSVEFRLDGQVVRLENSGPYTIAGEAWPNVSDVLPWLLPANGTHTLKVTPFSGSNASGIAGTPLTVTFTVGGVTNPPPQTGGPAVGTVLLVNADNGQVLDVLNDGDRINLATLPSRRLNIVAEPSGTAGSIRFGFNGNSNFRTESSSPFSLFGDNPGPVYNAFTPTVGQHTLTVTAFPGTKGTGAPGPTRTIRFKIVDSPVRRTIDTIQERGVRFGVLPWEVAS